MVYFTDHYNAISIDKLSSKTKIGKGWWCFNNSLFQSRLKENVKILSKDFPLKKILQFQDRIFFFSLKALKNNHSTAIDWWENTKSIFKENARTFSKNSTIQENIRTSRLKEDCKTYTKKQNFKPKIKIIIENLQGEPYQLESKQWKVAKLGPNIK